LMRGLSMIRAFSMKSISRDTNKNAEPVTSKRQ
jgi:hypothetical protein